MEEIKKAIYVEVAKMCERQVEQFIERAGATAHDRTDIRTGYICGLVRALEIIEQTEGK